MEKKNFDHFLELNFTGPSRREQSTSECLQKLSIDGNVPNKLTQGAANLVKVIENSTGPLERARALIVQQSLFNSLCPTLKKKIFELYAEVDPETEALDLEMARAHLVYNDFTAAKDYMEKARKKQGLTWAITGIIGKRTQFQERETTQLAALAKGEMSASTSLEPLIESRPHNSDVLLEKPTYSGELPKEFDDVDANNQPALHNLDIALLVLEAEYLLRSNPADDATTNENVLAIAERIICSPPNSVDWLLYTRALWLRSCVESHYSTRSIYTIERGILQMTDIMNGLHATEGADRLQYFNYLIPLPKWTIDTELAKRLVQIGGMSASAEIYDRLDLPVDAAVCYAASGDKEKALERLEGYLSHSPNDSRAWALKGDITLDEKAWEKAWDLGHSVSAKISLGKFYQSKGELDVARRHLKEALVADGDNLDTQFTLGCIDLQLQDFVAAERAFTKCVTIKQDEAKCWSNLGAVQFQLNKYEQALHSFERAIRVDQNEEPNLRVWANYITLASELRKWEIVVNSYRYMIDTDFGQDRYINPSVLTEMTAAFTMNVYSGSSLEKSFNELMCEKLPQRINDEPNLWRLSAKVNVWRGRPWDALKNYESGWQKVLESPDDSLVAFRRVVQWTAVLVDAYLTLGDLEGRIEGSKVCPDASIRAREAVQRALARGQAFSATDEYKKLASLAS